jgi:hypothetical protein
LGEQLSMLWSRDLPEAEAQALRERIATEPEVAVQWRQLCAAMDALGELPDELPAPPLRAPSRPQRRLTVPRAVPWLLAAAAAVALAMPRPRPAVVLAAGGQWVEGDLRLLAGDVPVDIDGKVWVSVEPAAGVARVERPEDPMRKSTWMGGLAGALVTVAVYEGSAVVHAAPGDRGVVVGPGETHQTGAPRAAPSADLSPEARQQNIARLEADLAAAQQALAEAKFEGALTRGQLVAMQGKPSEWPSDIPADLGPERFRAELEKQLEGVPDIRVTDVDCDEYPCIAAIEYTGTGDDDWHEPIGDAVRGWLEQVLGPDDLSLSLNNSRFRDGDRDARYMVFGAHTEGRDSDVGTRTEFRMDALVDELGQRLTESKP